MASESGPVRTILVGTDGSPSAAAAVAFGAELAAQLGARVVLVHAVGLLEHLPGHPTEPAVSVRAEVEHRLRTQWCQPLIDADVDHECVLEDGPPLLVLPRLAERHSADLIVVASHGAGNATVLPLGSTSHALVQVSTVPVMVVPSRSV